MLAHKLIPPLIGVAALLLAASVALAVVLLTSGNNNDAPAATPLVELATATATTPPRLTATATTPPLLTPTVTATPANTLSPDLAARVAALPDKLRNEVVGLLVGGRITQAELQTLLDDYANRNPNLLIGNVVESRPDSLALTVYATGEQVSVAVTPDTVVHAVDATLHPDELVLVVTSADGKTATTITGFGVTAP